MNPKKPILTSPSSISLFMECPRCFWLDKIKHIKRPAGIFPSLPSGMDRILKVHFDQHRSEKSPPEELEGKFPGQLFHDQERLNIWRSNRQGLRFLDKKSGIILMGALDDLFVTPRGLHAPLDFKTRGFPRKENTHEHYQHQMDIYSFLLEKNGVKPADFAILIFYHPISVNKNHDVVFDPDPVKVKVDRRRGERLFRDAVKCLTGKMPKASRECPFCNWNAQNK